MTPPYVGRRTVHHIKGNYLSIFILEEAVFDSLSTSRLTHIRRSSQPFHSLPFSLYGFSGVANYVICTHGEDVNAWSHSHGTPLRTASNKGHIDVVRVLLDHGANVNTLYKNKTPLISAYDNGHLGMMRLLLEHGADVDARDDFGNLLLKRASIDGQAEVVQLLLQHNADVNSRGYLDWTPLQEASLFGRTKVVQILLDHGADVALSSGHYHPLHIAIRKHFFEIVRLLVEHGADVNIRDGEDRTTIGPRTRWLNRMD